MIILGLTGPTGSGKSSIAPIAESFGAVTIDCDKVAREVTAKESAVLNTLKTAFGDDILDQNGELLRKKLAEKAFATSEKTEILNSIMLPVIAEKIKQLIATEKENGVKLLILDAPTLFESGIDSVCDVTVAVLCDRNLRKKRIISRDNLSDTDAEIRLDAGKPDQFYEKTDYIVENNGNLQDFTLKIETILETLMKGYGK